MNKHAMNPKVGLPLQQFNPYNVFGDQRVNKFTNISGVSNYTAEVQLTGSFL